MLGAKAATDSKSKNGKEAVDSEGTWEVESTRPTHRAVVDLREGIQEKQKVSSSVTI